MEHYIKNFNKKRLNEYFPSYVLGIDVGGTNTNLGVAGVKNSKPIILFSLNYKSKELDSILPAIENTITYAKNKYDIKIDFTCIGAAGIISPSNDSAELTNVEWNLNSKELTNKTSLKYIYIINDFQTIGYGINLLNPNNRKDIFQLRAGKNDINQSKATKAILGAGTGLGKSILIYDKHLNAYLPIKSEGGHGDLPVHNQMELQLAEFIKNLRGISQPLNYEEVLSGRGIENIYLFYRNKQKIGETDYTKEIDKSFEKASLISKYKGLDRTCKETFRLYTRFYARCAKNFVLDTLSEGGLYIAGGIAAKNKEIFTSPDFNIEFEKSHKRTNILKKIPINIILNYDLSLYGACYAAMYKLHKKQKTH